LDTSSSGVATQDVRSEAHLILQDILLTDHLLPYIRFVLLPQASTINTLQRMTVFDEIHNFFVINGIVI
jgi:hypothetical protein